MQNLITQQNSGNNTGKTLMDLKETTLWRMIKI